jgi:uncharacterized protein with HEPN domain
MLDAAREAISFAIGRCREDLDDDRQLTLSIVKLLEIIGEAATKLAEETRSKLADLPWSDIMGMRHHLIHAYFDIDLIASGRRSSSTFRVSLQILRPW